MSRVSNQSYLTEWYGGVYQRYIEDLLQDGFEVDEIYFSGFWSQGDGACFIGRVIDPALFLHAMNGKDGLPWTRKLLAAGGEFNVSVCHSGYYYHENSVSVNVDVDGFWRVMDAPTDFHETIIHNYDTQLDAEYPTLEADCTSFLRGKMQQLYGDLEELYEEEFADEEV
jgi:hypothetical protein